MVPAACITLVCEYISIAPDIHWHLGLVGRAGKCVNWKLVIEEAGVSKIVERLVWVSTNSSRIKQTA